MRRQFIIRERTDGEKSATVPLEEKCRDIGPTALRFTDKKENQIFLIYREIQMGSVAKSYMRKGFLILYMRKCTNI
jgi:hypothetical protein